MSSRFQLDGTATLSPLNGAGVAEHVPLKFMSYNAFSMEEDAKKRTVFYSSLQEDAKVPTIEACERDYEREGSLPKGWEQFVNSSTNRPFYRQSSKHAVTYTNMWDSYSACIIERAVEELCAKVPAGSNRDDWELALCIAEASKEDEVVIGYYFVRMKDRVLVWTEDMPVQLATNTEVGVRSRYAVGLALNAQFLMHIVLFFYPRAGMEDVVAEAKGFLDYNIVDLLTSEESLSTYTVEDADQILNVLDGSNATVASRNAAIILAAAKWRQCQHAHGETYARMGLSDSISGQEVQANALFKWIVSPAMFFLPSGYLHDLKRIYNDGAVHMLRWKQFQEDFLEGREFGWPFLCSWGIAIATRPRRLDSAGSFVAFYSVPIVLHTVSAASRFALTSILTHRYDSTGSMGTVQARARAIKFFNKSKNALLLRAVLFSFPRFFLYSGWTWAGAILLYEFYADPASKPVVVRCVVSILVGVLSIIAALVVVLEWDTTIRFGENMRKVGRTFAGLILKLRSSVAEHGLRTRSGTQRASIEQA